MDAQRIARPVLVAQSAAVAIQSEPGVTLGGPLRRADVAFVSIASVHGIPALPYHAELYQATYCRCETGRAAPCRPCGRIPATSCIVGSSRGLSRPAQFGLARSGYARSGPTSSRYPYGHLQASPCTVTPRRVLPRCAGPSSVSLCQAVPGRAASCRPCRAYPCPALACRVLPRRAPSDRVRPRIAAPCPVALTGVPLSCLARPRPAPLRSRFATSGLAKPRPATIGPALFALTGVSLSCPVKPRHVTPSRVSSCLVVPVRSTPCPDKQNPEHLRSRDLLKVHGGCTDVRDSTHERATKQPPSREPSANPVYHSRIVPVNRG